MNKAGFVVVLLCLLALGGCRRGDPDALWNVVNGQCVPDQQQRGQPKPCAEVDLAGGYAVLKDRNGPYQFLLIPTARVSGVESPELLKPDAPRYFAAAWDARRYVEQLYGQPLRREQVSLAINSRYGRSQNQLHIHVDCVRNRIGEMLRADLGRIGPQWAELDERLMHHRYRAMRIGEAQFLQSNPFALLAASVGSDPEEMARHTLVAVGATFEDGTPGFILLDGRAGLWPPSNGHGEDLQGHRCETPAAPR